MSNSTTKVLLMQNVHDLRKKLQETERSLKSLKKLQLDEEIEYDDDGEMRRFAKTVSYKEMHGPQTMQDLLENPEYDWADSAEQGSIKSGISTLPESSYAGFSRRPVPSSTPTRQQTAVSRINRDTREQNHVECMGQLSSLKDSNKKMLEQNHRLLSEVEKLTYELQSARAKVVELSKEVDAYREMVPDLEDKVSNFQAENEAHDRALRNAEERYDCCQYEFLQLQRKMKECKEDLDEIRQELIEEKKIRKSTEDQRDEALQNFLEVQETLEEYQKKTQEKIKKLEENEDHLRDSLTHGNREREELLEKMASMQEELRYQAGEIRKLEQIEDAENENKSDMEQQQMELRAQVSRLSSKLSKLEPEAMLTESLRRENTRLKTKIERQKEQLSTCQEEIEENRTMLVQLEQIAQQVQQNSSVQVRRNSASNDSGVHSHDGHLLHRVSRDNSWQEDAAEFTSRSHSSMKDVLSDLRMKITMKDAEIHKLKASLQASETSHKNSMLENIRTELTEMLDRTHSDDGRSRDMESTIGRLEADRNQMAGNLSLLNKDLSSKESQNTALEARLEQRNAQLIDLQEQINEKCSEITDMEREVRKKTSQINNLEEQLDDKMSEFTAQLTRMKELEDEVFSKEDEIQKLFSQVKELQKSESILRVNIEENRKIHQEQCKDYEKQIDLLQDQVERKKNHSEELERQLNNMRHDLTNKNIELQHVTKSWEDAQEEFKQKSTKSQEDLDQLEIKVTNGSAHVKQLESALLLCKEEIKSYMNTLDESKKYFDKEIALKEIKVLESEKQMQSLKTELKKKESEFNDLENLAEDQQEMLKQSTNRIGELEQSQSDLQQQTSHLEKQLVKQNAKFKQETQTLEKKLHSACEDIEKQTAQIMELSQTVKQQQRENDDLTREANSLDNQLQVEQDAGLEKTTKMKKMERELRDLRVEIEQKIEAVGDLEDKLHQKENDFEHRAQLVKDMEIEIKRLELSSRQTEVHMNDMEEQLQRSVAETRARDEMIEDLRDALRRTQEELNVNKKEADDLRVALDERQMDLQQRVSQVSQLDFTIKEHQQLMEQKVSHLESTLQKKDREVKERNSQIADLDDKLQTTHSELKEKSLVLVQTEQLAQKLELETHTKTSKIEEYEKVVERQKKRIDEQKTEMADTTQQLRLTREQLQLLHAEFTSTKRDLAHSRREQDKLSRELEDHHSLQQNKTVVQEKLEQEISSTKSKAADAEAKLLLEINNMKLEMEKMKRENQEQEEKNEEEKTKLLKEKEEFTKHFEQKLELLDKKENLCMERLENSLNDVDKFRHEKERKTDALKVAEEQLVLKDSEIVRLQTKISVLERAAQVKMASESFGALNDELPASTNAAYFNGNTGHVHLNTVGPFQEGLSHLKGPYSEENITEEKLLQMSPSGTNLSECSMEMTGSNFSDPFSSDLRDMPSSKHFEAAQISAIAVHPGVNVIDMPVNSGIVQSGMKHVTHNSFPGFAQESRTLKQNSQNPPREPDYSQARRFARTIPYKPPDKSTVLNTAQQTAASQQKTDPAKNVKTNVLITKKKLNITSDDKFILGPDFDPITAVNMYQTPDATLVRAEPVIIQNDGSILQSPEGSMIEIHERLKENERRQQEIDKELQNMEKGNVPAETERWMSS